ncbi:CRE-CDC-14 protein [Caenorhabditis remanei]|uniref:protein-tyrosine-phosphatase n=1 Tax=Caenorhabditis remanei TaxID=31234 RepID=E3M4R6_CAERE|nr:CRE-CDC-14 protein [Caenorhabditis remanei]
MREDHSPRRHHLNNNVEQNTLTELLPNQLYFGCFPNPDAIDKSDKSVKKTCFVSVNNKFHYEPFYEDFGPWNLSVLYRLCVQIDKLLEIEEKRGRRLVLFCQEDGSGDYDKIRVNTAYVLGAYLIIYQGFSADDAYLKVANTEGPKLIGFRDASMGAPQYLLHVHDVLRGIEKALKFGWLDFTNFDHEEYEHYERVENGDFNWIIPGKILSFCGPHNESREENGYPYHSPEVYFEYFHKTKVSTIVRLNAKNYDASKFTRAGFDHVDLFFVDGSTPSDEIMLKFINVVDNAKGGVAVHCKAGLGRTGTLIACWMMKEFGLTAGECMGWLRVCRPGSVIGPQQPYLVEKQKFCWSLSHSNGVHLIPNREDKRSVRRLVNQVDDINLGEERRAKSRENTRPNILRRKVQVQNGKDVTPVSVSSSAIPGTSRSVRTTLIVDETSLDEQGRSQGDRLLQLKAKHQHEAEQAPSSSSSRRFVKHSAPQMAVPSQAYLNRNREPIMITPSKNGPSSSGTSSRQSKTPSNGNVAYRTRNSSGGNAGTLTRTPASAVFPSMASRRSEATRYLSPTTPIKPMSPAYPDGTLNGTYKSRLRSEKPMGSTTSTPFSLQPQFGLVRVPLDSPHLVMAHRPSSARAPLSPHNFTSSQVFTPSNRFIGEKKSTTMTRGSASTSALPTAYMTRGSISKCTLTAETKTPKRILSMPSSSKSTSSLKKIQVSRPRPYPSNGVRVELCANGKSYAIRPRKDAHVIPGAGLAANTEALLGVSFLLI